MRAGYCCRNRTVRCVYSRGGPPDRRRVGNRRLGGTPNRGESWPMATSSGERNSDDRGRDEHAAEGGDDLLKHGSLLDWRDSVLAGPARMPIVAIRC